MSRRVAAAAAATAVTEPGGLTAVRTILGTFNNEMIDRPEMPISCLELYHWVVNTSMDKHSEIRNHDRSGEVRIEVATKPPCWFRSGVEIGITSDKVCDGTLSGQHLDDDKPPTRGRNLDCASSCAPFPAHGMTSLWSCVWDSGRNGIASASSSRACASFRLSVSWTMTAPRLRCVGKSLGDDASSAHPEAATTSREICDARLSAWY